MLKTIFTLTSFIVGLSLTLVGLELSEVSLPHRSENIIVLFLILLMINVTFSIHLDLSSPFNFVFFLAYTTILYILLTHPGESFNYICSCLVTLSPILIAILQKSKKDNPESYQYLFQDGASPLMEEVSILHNKIMLILIIIIFMVLWLIIKSLVSKAYYKLLTDGALVEIIWTTIPAIILFFIAFPSLKLLYIMDEVMDPALTIKVVGHQWYWSYEYSDYFLETWEFDSYLISIADLKTGGFRLLEVDNIGLEKSPTLLGILLITPINLSKDQKPDSFAIINDIWANQFIMKCIIILILILILINLIIFVRDCYYSKRERKIQIHTVVKMEPEPVTPPNTPQPEPKVPDRPKKVKIPIKPKGNLPPKQLFF